ncbi:unnamed protein product [Moneuplotes crassus]|uniref:Uncharacterized protein n=1 Tax=Euplotes crassus TaxID=5936 RepID=A0AAD1YAV6_EUPCR|nr:unnamed protein product [Moneuplotes crassus]
MELFPKCETFSDCGQATHIVRKTASNPLLKDVFACGKCMITTFSNEDCEPIPPIELIEECLDLIHYNITTITSFKDQHKLHKVWDGLVGELDSFRDSFLELRSSLRDIRQEDNWSHLSQFQDEVKAILNAIEDSRAMKCYQKQLQVRALHEHKNGRGRVSRDTQALLRNKLADFHQSIQRNHIAPLKEQLQKATQEAEQRKTQTEALEEEKTQMQENIQRLIQERDNFEQAFEISNQRQEQIDQLTQRIQILTEKEDKYNADAEEMKDQIANLEASLGESKCAITHEGLKIIHNSIMNSSDNFYLSSSLGFNLNTASWVTLLKALQLSQMPPLYYIQLNYVDELGDPEVMSRFVQNALSPSIKKFYFQSQNSSFTPIGAYMPALTKALPSIPEFISFYQFQMSKAQFEDLLVAAQHCTCVQVYYCKVDTKEELDFGDRLAHSTFETLNLDGTGRSAYSDWSQNGFVQFKNIVKGLAKVSQVKNRLIKLDLGNCELTRDLAESVLQENGMVNVTLEGI